MEKTNIVDVRKGAARHRSKRLVIFNHKGGVGKTTLTVNIASALADAGKKVLLVDSDPQCNLSSYLVEASVLDDVLDRSDSDSGETLWSALKPIVEAEGDVKAISAVERFTNVFLLYGDLKLADFEQELPQMWLEALQRKPRGYRAVTALSFIVNEVAARHDVDFIFYDCGPNIGALNRAILLDCDSFIIPAALDEFSIRALKTLGITLENWIKTWQTVSDLAPDGLYLLPGRPKLLGYVIQRFRVYGGQVSAGQAAYVPKFERQIYSDVVARLRAIDPTLASESIQENLLGEVRDFSSVAAMSQIQGVAIENVRGGSVDLKNSAKESFSEIAQKIIERC
jgi:cellulose biosynthesis protein BcsQ